MVSLVGIALGSFLRNDGYESHDLVGMVAEGAGWLGFMISGILLTQQTADEQVQCSLFGECIEPSLRLYLWDRWLGPIVLGALTGGTAEAAGWVAARVTKRNAMRPEGGALESKKEEDGRQ